MIRRAETEEQTPARPALQAKARQKTEPAAGSLTTKFHPLDSTPFFQLRDDGSIQIKTGLTGLTGLPNPAGNNPVNAIYPVSRFQFQPDTRFYSRFALVFEAWQWSKNDRENAFQGLDEGF